MNRFVAIAVLVLFTAGCSLDGSMPRSRDAKAVACGVLAVEGGVAPAPSPSPKPQPGDKCTNCNGTGRVGDGRVSVPCPVCGGDGKL